MVSPVRSSLEGQNQNKSPPLPLFLLSSLPLPNSQLKTNPLHTYILAISPRNHKDIRESPVIYKSYLVLEPIRVFCVFLSLGTTAGNRPANKYFSS